MRQIWRRWRWRRRRAAPQLHPRCPVAHQLDHRCCTCSRGPHPDPRARLIRRCSGGGASSASRLDTAPPSRSAAAPRGARPACCCLPTCRVDCVHASPQAPQPPPALQRAGPAAAHGGCRRRGVAGCPRRAGRTARPPDPGAAPAPLSSLVAAPPAEQSGGGVPPGVGVAGGRQGGARAAGASDVSLDAAARGARGARPQ